MKAGKTKQRIIDFFVVTHQWSGFILCIMFFVWFVSGFVLMYKDFPYIQQKEIIEKTKALRPNQSILSPKEVIPIDWVDKNISIKLTSLFDRPIYKIIDPEGLPHTFFADDGSRLGCISKEVALSIVSDFEDKSITAKKIVEDDWLDQWTPRTRFIPYLPWYKVYADDAEGTVYYVSSVNGEITQKLNLEDKIWAWLGAIPHWIYFKDLRITTQRWRDVVVALSIAGVLMSLTGIIVGIIRVRTNSGIRFSPYKKFWFMWHHYLGFGFGLFVFTFILSGLASMNPWSWSPPKSLSLEESKNWTGISFSADLISNSFPDAIRDLALAGSLKEVSFGSYDGFITLRAFYSDRQPVVALLDENSYLLKEKFDQEEIKNKLSAATGLVVKEFSELQEYDRYYIDKWNKRPLPVYKAKMEDEIGTLLYVNAHTGEVIYKYTTLNKWERWLYHGLHSFDFPWLLKYRPAWDIVMWIMGLGGLAVSITGVVLTYKWLKRKITVPNYQKEYRRKVKLS
jgi:hypothetical protein